MVALVCGVGLLGQPSFGTDETLLLRQPDISKNNIAFVYAGDLWIADRNGKNPKRLTSHAANETGPKFSPNGREIAFTANYDGNTDVYVISIDGGQPKRLTYHPGADTANGWTPDGKEVVFASRREVKSGRSNQIYHISTDGGYPTKMMDALAYEGVWSPNGERFAYRPHRQAYFGASGWRQYRGGATPPIWIYSPKDGALEKIPHDLVNDTNPMWLKDTVYFISDRADGAMNIHGYNTKNKKLSQLTKETVWDVRSAGAFGDHILFETGGHLKELNVRSGRIKDIDVKINPDLPQLRPQWKDASRTVQSIALSPTGKRALLSARGDVFTVPVKEGSTRNLTKSDGIREGSALWSPKGGEIAYISDEGMKHTLVIAPQTGIGKVRKLSLGDKGYFNLLEWSAKANRIIYSDNHLGLFAIDLASGERTQIAKMKRRAAMSVSLSKDGEWLAYTAPRTNFFDDVMLYSFESGETTALTDGMVHAGSPAFSKDGQYLYFTGSTNSGPSQSVWLDLSTQERPLRRGIYAAVLHDDGRSPLLPEAGDEIDRAKKSSDEVDEDDSADENTEETKKAPSIHVEGITNRIIALPVAERSYDSLEVAKDGGLFFIERIQPGISNEPPSSPRGAVHKLMRFDFKSKKASRVFDLVQNYTMSADGKTLLVQGANNRLMFGKASKQISGKPLRLTDVRMFVDPRKEWTQIFNDVWRMEAEYFYDPNMHGLDWQAVYDRFKPLVAHVGRREDLNTLMIEMIAEMQVGHNRIFGGDTHRERPVNVGLLGADLRIENGQYRIKDIYSGENWNPFLVAPLSAPGVDANIGDYIVAVNGRTLSGTDNIFSFFADTVGKQVTLTLSENTDGDETRDVVVEPIRNDGQLRNWRWIEDNRKYVEEKTDGRVGYVYVPNTAGGGFTYFNRMFFAQFDKEAVIIDERSNGGGQAANYITDILSREYLAGWKDRDAILFDTPGVATYGPKAMLIDQDAGSGGDFLPYSFQRMGLGKLIGTRTWGGLIGISANPQLIDGGVVTVPYFRFFTPDGEWRIENEGAVPDIEVELFPVDVNAGKDAQLDRAIDEMLNDLKTYKPIRLKKAPAYPTELGK
ncbi:PD40 domain-containing protein [Kordiimonas sp. SCSIO 12610]|nr:PD40 domain-containing protein [Kordiimonas sp. SCSIO 12610]